MTPPKTMSGVYLTRHGGPEVLICRDNIPVPTPASDEVLIEVGAAGVNNTDINTRVGWYAKTRGDDSDGAWSGRGIVFPRIQGADICGRIVAAGSGVDKTRIGERVLVEPCILQRNGQTLALTRSTAR